jgi:hypothetical protein
MPKKPFNEKSQSNQTQATTGSAKGGFEEKVQQELGLMVKRLNQLKDFTDKGKPEKDEQADKYAKDYGDIQKASKDQKDAKEHKHEKSEKERKEIVKESVKESDVGGLQTVPIGPDPQIEQRIAALENVVGKLSHFIQKGLRPELNKGALKQEPDQLPKTDQDEE